MDVAAIRAELAAAIDAGVDMVDRVDVTAVLKARPHLPAIQVGPPIGIDYHYNGYQNSRRLVLRVLVEVSRSDSRKAQDTLDALASWPGLASVIEAHDTALWETAAVTAVEEPRAMSTDDGIDSLAQSYTVTIHT